MDKDSENTNRRRRRRRKSWPIAGSMDEEEEEEENDISPELSCAVVPSAASSQRFSYSIRTAAAAETAAAAVPAEPVVSSGADTGLTAEELKRKKKKSNNISSGCNNENEARKRRIASIFQHYYPEGGWGYVVLVVAFVAQAISQGALVGMGSVLGAAVQRRFLVSEVVQLGWLSALSLSVSLLMSPVIVGVCLRKSTRLTAVMGGLVAALGCLFTSFAGQFHQLFLSYGILMGIGVGMVREPTNVMVGQYFKRRRALVEIVMVSASGAGISAMSAFVYTSVRHLGWRLGLQAVTGVLFLTFFLGTFYRSASLYHPQRRAILHLKSQKRKIKSKDKEKNKAQDDRPPYFDFATLKSRTVQILLCSTAVSSVGLSVPIFYLAGQVIEDGVQGTAIIALHIYLGIAWTLGCILCGIFITRRSSTECQISKQYLSQMLLFLSGLTMVGFAAAQGYKGHVMFVCTYGFFVGGYNYTLKMYVYEKVRARNFPRAWSFVQFSMSIPNLLGIPLAGYMNKYCGERTGHYMSAVFVLVGSLSLTLINVHRKTLYKRRKSKRKSAAAADAVHKSCEGLFLAATAVNANAAGDAAVAAVAAAECEFSNPVTLGRSPKPKPKLQPELSLFSEEGIADMDLPDQLFLEELEYLDNITSCDKVENCVMLSEYEQNLIKETASSSGGGRTRKWSFFGSSPPLPLSKSPEIRRTLGVGGLRQCSFTEEAVPGGGGGGSQRRKRTAGSNNSSNNNNKIRMFTNTSGRLRQTGDVVVVEGPKRSVMTVIDEASV